MVITLPPQVESALAAEAKRRGITPEALAIDVLRRQFPAKAPLEPIDEWERRLFQASIDTGVVVPDEALTSEGLYD